MRNHGNQRWTLIALMLAAAGLAACEGREVPKAPAPSPAVSETPGKAEPVKQAAPSATERAATAASESSARAEMPAAETPAQSPAKAAKAPSEAAPRPAARKAPMPAGRSTEAPAPKPSSGASAPEALAPAPAPAQPKAAAVAPAGDAKNGARIGRKCLSCHNTNARRKVGPGLAGVVGRKAGSMPDMKYSPALAAGGWVWDAGHLAAWVCDSQAAVRTFTGDANARTKMPAQRICDPARQADLIAWLATLK